MKDRPKLSISPRGQGLNRKNSEKPDKRSEYPTRAGSMYWFTRWVNLLPKWVFKPSFFLASGSLLVCFILVLIITARNADTLYSEEIIPWPQNYDPATAIDTFSIRKEDFEIIPEVLQQDESLDQFFFRQPIKASDAQELVRQAALQGIFELKKGKWFRIGYAQEGQSEPQYYEYSPDEGTYIAFQVSPPQVRIENRPVEIKRESRMGILTDSIFFNAVVSAGIDLAVVAMVEEALQWSVDLYHVLPGDKFKIVYESRFAGETRVGTGRLLAVWFKSGVKEHYAYLANGSGSTEYVDQFGKTLKRTFIKSPLKYGRISSRYSLNRKHPVYGDNRPHFGTDYAAPEGTEIMAVADGIVAKAEEKGANGLYVKLDHGQGIATQYLHMSTLGPGIRSGARVQQGQVIGYVGSTGASTGPHVCFRFWKNNQQIDHLDESMNLDAPNIQPDAPASGSFVIWRDSMNIALENARYKGN